MQWADLQKYMLTDFIVYIILLDAVIFVVDRTVCEQKK